MRLLHVAYAATWLLIGLSPVSAQTTPTESTAFPIHQIIEAPPPLALNQSVLKVPFDVDSAKAADKPIGPKAPAPALTRVSVYAVGSSKYGGWEYLALNQLSTKFDHGGATLRAVVLEIGYGSNQVATMNGGYLARSKQIQTTLVCITNGYYSWPCSAGQSVVGFLYTYDLSGYESGRFTFQDTSTNSPFRTLSTFVTIL